jgi:hypothetical protein
MQRASVLRAPIVLSLLRARTIVGLLMPHLPMQFPSGRPFPEAFARAYLLQQQTMYALQSPYFVTEMGLMRFLREKGFPNLDGTFNQLLKSYHRPFTVLYPPSGAQLFHIDQLDVKGVNHFIQTHPTPGRFHQPDIEWAHFGVRWDILSLPKTLPCSMVSTLLHTHRSVLGLTQRNLWMDSRVVHHFHLLPPHSPTKPVQLPLVRPWYSLDHLMLNSRIGDCVQLRLEEIERATPSPDSAFDPNPEFDEHLIHPTIAAFFNSSTDHATFVLPHHGVPSATWSYLKLLRETQDFPSGL